MKRTLTSLALALFVFGCPSEDDESMPYDNDAQYICDTLTDCFGLELGPRCAQDIEDTTTAADIARCADCYSEATCEDIGEPGVPGVCDVACQAALFETR